MYDRSRSLHDPNTHFLLEAALAHGAEVRFGHELTTFSQDGEGVTATLYERKTGEKRTVRAAYLLGADGANSLIRQSLAIPVHGPGTVGHYVNIYFDADLSELVRDRWFGICFVENGEREALFLAVNNADRWLLNVPYYPERGESADLFTPERCCEEIRRAVGISDLAVSLRSVLP